MLNNIDRTDNRDRENRDGNYRWINFYKKNIKYKDIHVNPFHDLKCGGKLKKSLKFKKSQENKKEHLCNTLISPPSQLNTQVFATIQPTYPPLVLGNAPSPTYLKFCYYFPFIHFLSNQTNSTENKSLNTESPLKHKEQWIKHSAAAPGVGGTLCVCVEEKMKPLNKFTPFNWSQLKNVSKEPHLKSQKPQSSISQVG